MNSPPNAHPVAAAGLALTNTLPNFNGKEEGDTTRHAESSTGRQRIRETRAESQESVKEVKRKKEEDGIRTALSHLRHASIAECHHLPSNLQRQWPSSGDAVEMLMQLHPLYLTVRSSFLGFRM
jgi:hypothetical protein